MRARWVDVEPPPACWQSCPGHGVEGATPARIRDTGGIASRKQFYQLSTCTRSVDALADAKAHASHHAHPP